MKEKYDELQAKYQLPAYELLDQLFQISSLDAEQFILREVLKRMENRLDYCAAILEEILHPSPDSITNMHEYKVFTQEDKKVVFELYKKIQFFSRSIIEALILCEEPHQAKLIIQISQEYPNIKQGVLIYLRKMKDSWLQDDNLQEILEYLG